MTSPKRSVFTQISQNNQIVNQAIDNFVQIACRRSQFGLNDDKEVEKTTQLVLLSSLCFGDFDNPSD